MESFSFWELGEEKTESRERLALRIANAVVYEQCRSIGEICILFGLTGDEAVTLLNSKEFLALVKKLKRVRKVFGMRKAINILSHVIANGKSKERLAALDILEQLIERDWIKKG